MTNFRATVASIAEISNAIEALLYRDLRDQNKAKQCRLQEQLGAAQRALRDAAGYLRAAEIEAGNLAREEERAKRNDSSRRTLEDLTRWRSTRLLHR